MARRPGREKLEAWVGVVATFSTVMRELEAELLADHDLPISWFDILNRLDQAPGRRLRMHELERVSVFTRSGITRVADRLEAAGLVERVRSTDDRRGVLLAVTDAGLAKLREAWPDHERGIEEHFGRHLTVGDARALRALTAKVLGAAPDISGHAGAPG